MRSSTKSLLMIGGCVAAIVASMAVPALAEDHQSPFDGAGVYIDAGAVWSSADHSPSSLLAGIGATVPSGSGDATDASFGAGVWIMRDWDSGVHGGLKLGARYNAGGPSSGCGTVFGAGITCDTGDMLAAEAMLQLGVTVDDAVLVYLTGGGGVASYETSTSVAIGPINLSATDDQTEAFYAVGAGAKFAAFDGVNLTIEYTWTDYGDTTTSLVGIPINSTDLDAHRVSAGLEFEF